MWKNIISKKAIFSEKNIIQHKICIWIFCITFSPEIFLILKELSWILS